MQHTLQNIAESSLDTWLAKLIASPYEKVNRPSIALNQRGRIAGAALLQKNLIKLQPKLFAQNQSYFISNVIPHELAHIVVYQYFGRVKPHGKEWQYVMRDIFGLKPAVTHSLDVKKAGLAMFDYKCQCNTVQLTAVRHNKILRDKQRYVCKKCHQSLELAV